MGSGGHPGNSRATIGVRLRSSSSPARGPQAGRGVSSRSQGCRNLGPGGAGHAPRDRFLQLGGDGRWQQGLPKPLGARFSGRAQRVSGCCGRSGLGWPPQLARRDCQRQRHPPVTAPRARGDGDATEVLPQCQWSKAAGVLGQHLHLPPRRVPAGVPQGCTPPMAPPERAGEQGAALPCPPSASSVAEAEHYLPRPSEAAARGCTLCAQMQMLHPGNSRLLHLRPDLSSIFCRAQRHKAHSRGPGLQHHAKGTRGSPYTESFPHTHTHPRASPSEATTQCRSPQPLLRARLVPGMGGTGTLWSPCTQSHPHSVLG